MGEKKMRPAVVVPLPFTVMLPFIVDAPMQQKKKKITKKASGQV